MKVHVALFHDPGSSDPVEVWGVWEFGALGDNPTRRLAEYYVDEMAREGIPSREQPDCDAFQEETGCWFEVIDLNIIMKDDP